MKSMKWTPVIALMVIIALAVTLSYVGCGGGGSSSSDSGSSAPLFSTGVLDQTFGNLGVITNTIGIYDNKSYAMALQTDGKIVLAGGTDNGSNWDIALARYTVTGTLDATFGTGGITSTAVGSDNAYVYALAIQPDGKILAAGYAYNGANNDFALLRYTVTGTLDTTFDTDGIVTTTIGSAGASAKAIVLQSDNKILVAGESHSGANNDIALVRYYITGTLDASFGAGGIVTATIGSNNEYTNGIALQTNGRIIVAGATNSGNEFALFRYNSDGSPDTTFSADGIVTTTIGSGGATAFDIALQADGKIIAAGTASNGVNNDFALARYNTDGSLDITFDNDGVVTSSFGTGQDYANAVVLQSDGKIIAAGASDDNVNFALIRYNTNGSLDTTFGTGGGVTTSPGTSEDIFAIALQPDNKIVVSGISYNGSYYNFALARYWR